MVLRGARLSCVYPGQPSRRGLRFKPKASEFCSLWCHIGWKLQVQTNSINVGISNNWQTVTGSSTVNTWSLPIDPANGCVFCRLIYP